jgi:hypothetical protein
MRKYQTGIRFIIVVLMLVAAGILPAACVKYKSTTEIHMKAWLLLGDNYKTEGSSTCTVKIVNTDDFDWHNVVLNVDELYLYKDQFKVIKAGETLMLSLADYKLGGESFDVKKYVPYKVGGMADEGWYFWGWQNRAELGQEE